MADIKESSKIKTDNQNQPKKTNERTNERTKIIFGNNNAKKKNQATKEGKKINLPPLIMSNSMNNLFTKVNSSANNKLILKQVKYLYM